MKKCFICSVLTILPFLSGMSCEPGGYPDRVISQEMRRLFYISEANGNKNETSDTLILHLQGGPGTDLETTLFDRLIGKVRGADNILRVNMHQIQTQNASLFKSTDITLEQAKRYNLQTIDSIAKVIQYFKSQGRKVFVIGISYGAFLTQLLIAEKGISVADKYLIMVGRLDIEDVFWQAFGEGKQGSFPDGVTPVVEPSPQSTVEPRNMSRLSAGVGYNRFTERFKDIDLSNVTYVYGTVDQQLGRLSDKEIAFLTSKNASIIVSPLDHQPTFVQYIDKGCEKAFGIKIKAYDRTITDEIHNLIYISKANGNANESSDTAIVHLQGGAEGVPVTSLESADFDKLIGSQKSLDKMLRVTVHQVQTQDPSKFSSSDITFDQAKQFGLDNMAIVEKVIKYFKAQGRIVLLMGESYGSSVILELIAQRGLTVANGYLLFTCRMDMNDVFWTAFSEGRSGRFTNGIIPVLDAQPASTPLLRNMSRLAAGLWFSRYTERIQQRIKEGTITYIPKSGFVYGLEDVYVGALTENETSIIEKQFFTNVSVGKGSQKTVTNGYLSLGLKAAWNIK